MNTNDEEELASALPPAICNNPRKKIQPEFIDSEILITTPRQRSKKSRNPLMTYFSKPSLPPCPRSALAIIWSPDRVFFDLEDNPIIRKLWIWNGSSRMIYIHCCGLWNDTARLGASWRTYPRTRFLLAPGLRTELSIKATPRATSPVPCAVLCLQLAASHLRDTVTGYFAVPVTAKFIKYQISSFGEDG